MNWFQGTIFWLWNCLFWISGISYIVWVGNPNHDTSLGTFLLCLFLGITIYATSCIALRKETSKGLLTYFYCVEAPIFLVACYIAFQVHTVTLGILFLLITFLIAFFCIFQALYREKKCFNKKIVHFFSPVVMRHIILAMHNIMLIAAIYILLVSVFYLPIVVYNFLDIIVGTGSIFGVIFAPFVIIFYALFFPIPPFIVVTYSKVWSEKFKKVKNKINQQAYANIAVVVLLWLCLFNVSSSQSQMPLRQLLASKPTTVSELTAFSDNFELVRKGLLEQYLYKNEMWSERTSLQRLKASYVGYYHVSPEDAQILQDAFNELAAPFHLQGKEDVIADMEKEYEEIFDTPLVHAEREVVLRNLQRSYDERSRRSAGLLSIDAQKVLVTEQQISIKDHGYYADVKVFERYQNKTFRQQEISYYFSVPKGVVIRDVKMGVSEDEALAFPCDIASRGAAQKVYSQEKRRRQDPALLEQVGAQQYRLRVFPIPETWRQVEGQANRGELCLWMTIQTLRTSKGFALPKLLEKRNVYWDENQEFVFENKKIKRNRWLPEYATSQENGDIEERTVFLPEGYAVTIRPKTLLTPSFNRIAVVLDTSYSMTQYMGAAFDKALHGFKGIQKDVYCISAIPEATKQISLKTAKPPLCYGRLSQSTMLNSFNKLRGNKQYDAVFLLTDKGSYTYAVSNEQLGEISEPVWMIHLGEQPVAYEDGVLDALHKNRGGAIYDTQLDMPTSEYVSIAEKRLNNIFQDNEYEFVVQESATPSVKEEGAQQIAAHMVIEASSANKGLAQLDELHELAQTYHIVSPYSSMLVLVNQWQKSMLRAAEKSKDRFTRQSQKDEDFIEEPTLQSLSAVPEPHEWVLIIVGILLLFFFWRREKAMSNF